MQLKRRKCRGCRRFRSYDEFIADRCLFCFEYAQRVARLLKIQERERATMQRLEAQCEDLAITRDSYPLINGRNLR